jgi:hypothetical protein
MASTIPSHGLKAKTKPFEVDLHQPFCYWHKSQEKRRRKFSTKSLKRKKGI